MTITELLADAAVDWRTNQSPATQERIAADLRIAHENLADAIAIRQAVAYRPKLEGGQR